ncbi:hypothetical protein PROFUN_15625 [Planoprotostelium fungivorum]|uniref:Gamma-butyrobetaine hydroxylase-like N-terminal domain-containing protein n=1 Tax=Planoprotostelium fungivorum TaxID=1890364 RepID=A0A2P6MVC8_9EUKA|nr:hypothetical protein PROFUN_15625 [Planoprotostelium fungivorum]
MNDDRYLSTSKSLCFAELVFRVAREMAAALLSFQGLFRVNSRFLCRKLSTESPTRINLRKDKKVLSVTYPDKQYTFSAEYLRVMSPSAEKQSGTTKRIVAGRQNVSIIHVEKVGNYAVRLIFDDMHETGIYSWPFLKQLGDDKWRYMREYIQALRASGKSRDPRATQKREKNK